MALAPFLRRSLCVVLASVLASCGGGDEQAPPDDPPAGSDPASAEEPPPAKTTRTVRANEAAKSAALDRLETMKQITAVLKPLRDPAAALAAEAELQSLFAEYNRLGQVAAAEGIDGRLLEALTAHLAPDEWRDVRAEFQQYMLLVRQLGDPQKEMMDRVMGKPAP